MEIVQLEISGIHKNGKSASSFVIRDPITEEELLEYSSSVEVKTTNQAEWMALMLGFMACG